jgi:Negative regulator of beta-lactamase expression
VNILDVGLSFSNLSKRANTNRIMLHHSGVTVLQSVEVVHNYHIKTNGYSGIGYHFYVRKDGAIYKGRPEDCVGAHALGDRANFDSIGICFEGNFSVEDMSEAQKQSGKELVSYLKQKYGINRVQGHREVNSTSCPGTYFPFAEIAEVPAGITLAPDADMNHNGVEDIKEVIKNLQRAINNTFGTKILVDGVYRKTDPRGY